MHLSVSYRTREIRLYHARGCNGTAGSLLEKVRAADSTRFEYNASLAFYCLWRKAKGSLRAIAVG